ncbi:MAG: site-2 protease family protein [Candidatus Saccharibacteria bacterium]|nr:site-2 protease family protein [Candidatus Saccharibacteria bacterium]
MDINLIQIFILLVVILVSMTLHEMVHAYVGYWLGDDTAKHEGRLTLNPLAHIDPFLTILLPILLAVTGAPIFGGAKPVPFNPHNIRWGEFGAMLVGIAGPISNLLLAFLGFGLLAIVGVNGAAGSVLSIWIYVNLGFFIFNILPIPPLDGSRLLYYLAPDSIRTLLASVEQYGLIVVFAIILLFSQYLAMYMQAAINFFLSIFAAIFGVVI